MATSFPLAAPLGGPRSARAGIGGPKSAAGKARSAVNAVKHGLSSTNPVILDHETVEAWEAFRNAFIADLRPVGTVEEELARDLALTQWRRRRIPLFEAQAANTRMAAVENRVYQAAVNGADDAAREALAADALNQALLPVDAALDRILRYEAHLDRKFNTTLRHLERLQKARRQHEAENCETNSTPNLLPPPVPSVPPDPTLTPANLPLAENYKTNSAATEPTPTQPAPSARHSPMHQPDASVTTQSPERGARPLVVPLAGYPRERAGRPPDREGRGWARAGVDPRARNRNIDQKPPGSHAINREGSRRPPVWKRAHDNGSS